MIDLFGRFTVSKAIREISMIEVVLAASKAKLDAALNIRRDRKTYLEFFYKVSVPSAMVGFPITPIAMSNLFINDAYSAVRKSIKKLRSIAEKAFRKLNLSFVVYSNVNTKLREVEDRLRSIEALQAEQCVNELMKCIDDLLALCSDMLSALRSATPSIRDEVSGI